MASEDIEKRELNLASLDDINLEATRLLESGYQANGKWSLGQACSHLADWARFPMDGFPKPPLFLRAFFGVLKLTGSVEKMKTSILNDGFKPGTPTAPETVPASGAVSDAEGVAKLAEVLERMKDFDGPLQPSPLFGAMERELWEQVTLIHAEHHLAFLIPNQPS